MTVPLIMAVYILPTMGGLASLGRWNEWAAGRRLDLWRCSDRGRAISRSGLRIRRRSLPSSRSSIPTLPPARGGFFALAEDNLAPRILVKCSKERGVPYVAVLSLGLFSLIVCVFPFGVIVVVDVILFMSAYALIFISACILRVKEGDLHRPFRVPIGTKTFIAMCVPALIIIFVAFFINGTDYFVGGMTALATGPIMYFIFKRKYGGLTEIDPVTYPVNPRTGLGIGDTRRLTWMLAAMTLVGAIAAFFLPWYEDPGYYTETYGIEGLFDLLISGIRWMTIACGVATVIMATIAKGSSREQQRDVPPVASSCIPCT